MLRRTPEGDVIDVPEDEFLKAKEATRKWLRETEEGRQFRDYYLTDQNAEKLRQQIEFHNLPVDFQNLTFAFTILRDSGQLTTEEQEEAAREAEAEAADTRPRDRKGRLLSESQIEWGEMTRWADEHSAEECRQRARSDPKFAQFRHTNLVREMNAAPIDGAVPEPITHEATAAERQELEEFARAFVQSPASSRKPIMGIVTLAGKTYRYPAFITLVNRCAEAQLI